MNPEFKRNCWQEISTVRLIMLPTLLLLIFALLRQSGSVPERIAVSAGITFLLLTVLWGGYCVFQSLTREFDENTWDQQQMSALSPWAMTCGKLFGAPIMAWYGGLICLLAQFSSSSLPLGQRLIQAGTFILISVFVHAIILLVTLRCAQTRNIITQRPQIILAVLGLFMLSFGSSLMAVLMQPVNITINWYGFEFQSKQFIFVSALFFTVCAVFAAWRTMSTSLQVRTIPWAWPLQAILLAGWLTGFAYLIPSLKEIDALGIVTISPMQIFLYFCLLIGTIMTYLAVFTDNNGSDVWRRILARGRSRNWRALLEQLPLWPTTCILVLLALPFAPPAALEEGVPSSVFYIAALIMLRDIAIVHFFALGKRPERATAAALFTIVLLNFLLPLLSGPLKPYFFPILHDSSTAGLVTAAVHLAIAAGLLIRQWKTINQQFLKNSQPRHSCATAK